MNSEVYFDDKRSYNVRYHLFSRDHEVRTVANVYKSITFLELKNWIFMDLMKDNIVLPEESDFYELVISYGSLVHGNWTVFFPPVLSSVVSTLSVPETNYLMKAKLLVVNFRRFWHVDSLSIELFDTRGPWRSAEKMLSSPDLSHDVITMSALTRIGFNTIQESLRTEISNVALFQGKLQRRYEYKRKEYWR
jgi:hypothetical protein